MATFSLRLFGLLLLTLAIGVSSCQALLPSGMGDNSPAQLSPGSFGTER